MLSVDLNGRVIYWDPLAVARRVGTALCFAHASAVPAPSGWVVCDRRGPNPMILVPPVQPTPVLVSGGGEARAAGSTRPEPVEWYQSGVGWDDPLDGDDDNTVVVSARRPSRVQFEDRPRPPLVLVSPAEPADLRWDIGANPVGDTAGDPAGATAPGESNGGRPAVGDAVAPPIGVPVSSGDNDAGDRPWWADPNELVDLSVEPGPQTPLLARAFRGSGPMTARRREADTPELVGVRSPRSAEIEDDITAKPFEVLHVLPVRARAD